MSSPRYILHVDLDAFFASVEQRDEPSLRGKPVLVGGSRERGVVAAASYEARRYGVHSAMPMAEALRLCPQAVVVRHHMERYLEASEQFFDILRDFSPLVEPLSVDEAFVDVGGLERLLGNPVSIARQIKERVRDETELVASIGIAPTKFAAKIASDLDKPDGLVVVEHGRLTDFLSPLPISRLWGVGAKTQAKLGELGLHKIGDVARYPEEQLCRRLGPGLGGHLAALSRGDDPRAVVPGRDAVSLGHEETFERDVSERDELRSILLGQADKVAARLRASRLRCRTVVLKLKYADFRQITRQRTLESPSSDGNVIGRTAVELMELETLGTDKSERVRLCGVSAAKLEDRQAPRQLDFDEEERRRGEELGDALDKIHAKFGKGLVARASKSSLSRKE